MAPVMVTRQRGGGVTCISRRREGGLFFAIPETGDQFSQNPPGVTRGSEIPDGRPALVLGAMLGNPMKSMRKSEAATHIDNYYTPHHYYGLRNKEEIKAGPRGKISERRAWIPKRSGVGWGGLNVYSSEVQSKTSVRRLDS